MLIEGNMEDGRSLEETPTWSVATVITVMVFVCLFVERSIYRFGRVRELSILDLLHQHLSFLTKLTACLHMHLQWLKKTRRKALFASVEKIKEGDQFHSNIVDAQL